MHNFQMLFQLYWLCWITIADLSKKPKQTKQNPTNKTNKNPTSIQPAPSSKEVAKAKWRHSSCYRGTTAVGNLGNIWKGHSDKYKEVFKNTIWALLTVSHHKIPLPGVPMDKTSCVMSRNRNIPLCFMGRTQARASASQSGTPSAVICMRSQVKLLHDFQVLWSNLSHHSVQWRLSWHLPPHEGTASLIFFSKAAHGPNNVERTKVKKGSSLKLIYF